MGQQGIVRRSGERVLPEPAEIVRPQRRGLHRLPRLSGEKRHGALVQRREGAGAAEAEQHHRRRRPGEETAVEPLFQETGRRGDRSQVQREQDGQRRRHRDKGQRQFQPGGGPCQDFQDGRKQHQVEREVDRPSDQRVAGEIGQTERRDDHDERGQGIVTRRPARTPNAAASASKPNRMAISAEGRR